MPGRKMQTGNSFPTDSTASSASAFVKVYVLGDLSNHSLVIRLVFSGPNKSAILHIFPAVMLSSFL